MIEGGWHAAWTGNDGLRRSGCACGSHAPCGQRGVVVQPLRHRRSGWSARSPAEEPRRSGVHQSHVGARGLQFFPRHRAGKPVQPQSARSGQLREGIQRVSEPAGGFAHPGRVLCALRSGLGQGLQLLLLGKLHYRLPSRLRGQGNDVLAWCGRPEHAGRGNHRHSGHPQRRAHRHDDDVSSRCAR
ncbi:hypothetical protein D3C72_1382820 [compost metagenome]